MNKKAFTLTELLAIIIIIALVSLVAIPTVYKLQEDNETTAYEYYYKSIQEASLVYAKTQVDLLGGANDTGCIKVDIKTLIDAGYLKKFDKATINEADIVVRNVKGKITSKVYLDIGSEEYGEEDLGVCNAYSQNKRNTLRDVIVTYSSLNLENGYIVGENPDNYVWYSGKLWRAFYVDKKTKQVKLISDDIISVIPFNVESKSSVFKGSYIENWLNNYFFNHLYNPNTYIASHSWVYDSNEKAKDKVGLISSAESNNSGLKYLQSTQYNWNLDEASGNNATVNRNNNLYKKNIEESYGIRPVIYINSNITVSNGNGMKSEPFELNGNEIPKRVKRVGINKRLSGEYVKIEDELFRIVKIENGLTKLVSVNPIKINNTNVTLPMNTNNYSLSNVYDNVEEYLKTNGLIKYITSGDWCLADNNTVTDFTTCGENNNSIQTFSAGIPQYTEMFSSYSSPNTNSNELFWTLTPDKNLNMIAISSSGTAEAKSTTTSLKVRYSIYIKSNVLITGGAGTEAKPFIL